LKHFEEVLLIFRSKIIPKLHLPIVAYMGFNR
jgi:hypothetical protein